MTPYVNAVTHSWNLDTYGKGLDGVPYPVNIVNDLKAARADLMNWYHKPEAPTDPADNSDPKYDYLSPMTFDSYLTETKGFHPADRPNSVWRPGSAIGAGVRTSGEVLPLL